MNAWGCCVHRKCLGTLSARSVFLILLYSIMGLTVPLSVIFLIFGLASMDGAQILGVLETVFFFMAASAAWAIYLMFGYYVGRAFSTRLMKNKLSYSQTSSILSLSSNVVFELLMFCNFVSSLFVLTAWVLISFVTTMLLGTGDDGLLGLLFDISVLFIMGVVVGSAMNALVGLLGWKMCQLMGKKLRLGTLEFQEQNV